MDQSVDLVCIGNATIDVFVLLKDLPNFSYDKFSNCISFPLGEKIPLDEHVLSLGGNACNVSVGLARLGMKTSLAAEIGSDEFSDKILNSLKKENVDISLIKRDEREEPYFNIILAYGGDRTILEEKNPNEVHIEIGTTNAKYFYLTSFNGNWTDVYDNAFEKNPNSLFVFNPGSRQLKENFEKVMEFIPKMEILFVNLTEAQKITGKTEPDVKLLLEELKEKGAKIAVITDGINGSYAIDKNGEMFHVGIIAEEKPIERTGAGDSYATGFIYGIMQGLGIGEAMRFGAINADFVIKKVGAQKGLLRKEELEKEAKENLSLTAVRI